MIGKHRQGIAQCLMMALCVCLAGISDAEPVGIQLGDPVPIHPVSKLQSKTAGGNVLFSLTIAIPPALHKGFREGVSGGMKIITTDSADTVRWMGGPLPPDLTLNVMDMGNQKTWALTKRLEIEGKNWKLQGAQVTAVSAQAVTNAGVHLIPGPEQGSQPLAWPRVLVSGGRRATEDKMIIGVTVPLFLDNEGRIVMVRSMTIDVLGEER